MRIFLFILGILAFVSGLATCNMAKSAIHEIEAYILFVIFAVCVAGAAVVESIGSLRKSIEAGRPKPSPEPATGSRPKSNLEYYIKPEKAE